MTSQPTVPNLRHAGPFDLKTTLVPPLIANPAADAGTQDGPRPRIVVTADFPTPDGCARFLLL